MPESSSVHKNRLQAYYTFLMTRVNMRIQDILPKLYDVTLTPLTIDYLTNPEVKMLIKALCQSDYRILNCPNVTDKEIEDTVNFLLRLIDTPIDIQGVLCPDAILRHLISSGLNESNTPISETNLFEQITNGWFETLNNTPPEIKKRLKKKPDIERAAILRFHTDVYEDLSKFHTDVPLYKAYSYYIHKQIRTVSQKSSAAHETLEAYIRAARYFFLYQPESNKRADYHLLPIPDEYIKCFTMEYDRINKGLRVKNMLSQAAYGHRNKFIALIEGRQLVHKGHVGGTKGVSIEEDIIDFMPVDGVPDITDETDIGGTLKRYFIKCDTSEEECDRFEAEPEFVLYKEVNDEESSNEKDLEDDIIAKPPSIRNSWQDLIHLRSFHFFWDSNFLNLFHYSVMYTTMREWFEKSSYHKAIVSYLIMLMHTGINEMKLLNLEIVDDEVKTGIGLKKIGDRYYMLNPSLINIERIKEGKECLDSSDTVFVPIPYPINYLLEKMLIHGRREVFSYEQDGEYKALSLIDVENFINKEINGKYAEYNLRITIPKILASFLPLYSSRFGLDPIICCVISGKDHHRLYKSQCHYIHVEHKLLENQYLKTFNLVNNAIQGNIISCIENGYIPSGSQTKTKTFDEDGLPPEDLTEVGYGSTVVCRNSYFGKMIISLNEALSAEQDFIKRHNLYSIYTYLCLQFSTGLRPRNAPDITWKDYNEHAGVIRISDKQSAIYHEERILPVPCILKTILNRMRTGFKAFQTFIATDLNPEAVREEPCRVFFFVDDKGNFTDFTIMEMKKHLEGIGIIYSLPANAPRHYMRNYLYHAGVTNDAADVFMGHQHAGRELLSSISSTALKEAQIICLPYIERILEETGFKDMPYMATEG